MILSLDPKNVLGTPLQKCPCEVSSKTGFYRDNYCATGVQDRGTHTVCARMTAEFLENQRGVGNDLTKNHGAWFPGLKPGISEPLPTAQK